MIYRFVNESGARTMDDISPKYLVSNVRHALGIGSVGPDVIEVHNRLYERGLSCAQHLITDDFYDERSQACVSLFQIANDLVPNGAVDHAEWDLLLNDHAYVDINESAQRWLIPSGNGERNDEIYYSPYAQKSAYFTFNGISDGSRIRELIGILQKNSVPATFFLTPTELNSYENFETMLSSDLFHVGYLATSTQFESGINAIKKINDDIFTMNALMQKNNTSKKLRCLRPSYDMLSAERQFALKNMDAPYIRWHVDPQNWRKSSPDIVADHVIDHTQPGEIIMISLENADDQQTLLAIDKIIRAMIADGWIFEDLRC
jgi:peptidoglycan/xylan/chitin deacetylase (PgdA/CDA1 family)